MVFFKTNNIKSVNKPLRSADAMITLTQTPFSSSTLVSLEKPPAAFPLNLKPLHHSHKPLKVITTTELELQKLIFLINNIVIFLQRKKIKRGICRAEFSHDAPFVIAIGTCMFSSLVLATPANDEEDAETVLDSTDARLAVMGIISFIPYFNWLVSSFFFFFPFRFFLLKVVVICFV